MKTLKSIAELTSGIILLLIMAYMFFSIIELCMPFLNSVLGYISDIMVKK